MPFPEGNYGAVLDSTPGPGKLASGETHTIVSHTASGTVTFGRAVRRADVLRRTVVQGAAGASTYTPTGTLGLIADQIAIGATTLTFDSLSISVDFSTSTNEAAIAAELQRGIRAAATAGTGYATATVTSLAGTGYVLRVPGTITAGSAFAGTGADVLGLDSGTITGPALDRFMGIARMDRAAADANNLRYLAGDDVGVIARGDVWVFNTGTVAATVDLPVRVTVDNEGQITADSTNAAVLPGAVWIVPVPAGRLGRIRMVAVQQRD